MRTLLNWLVYRKIVRPYLFRKYPDPEDAHDKTSALLAKMGDTEWAYPIRRSQTVTSHRLTQTICGIHFPNPIGLAAGMDKTGAAIAGFDMLGFGFQEPGAVLPRPQAGNDRQRMFRLPKDEALINRMGFNSPGMHAVYQNLRRLKPYIQTPLGVNVGKNKDTPNEEAAKDYTAVITHLADVADYFTINVSSPNTPGLRQLLGKKYLVDLLNACKEVSVRTKDNFSLRLPLFVKVSPDQTDRELAETIEACLATGMAGIIATNTTQSREGLTLDPGQSGGMSGPPLKKRALHAVKFIKEYSPGGTNLTIMASGGIRSLRDILDYLEAGASLFQVYTGLVYEGPDLPRSLNQSLRRYLRRRNKTMRTLRT